METYEWWAHRRTAGVFGIRLDGDRIVGIAGPLDLDQLPDDDLPHLRYHAHGPALDWVRRHPEQFVQAEPFLRGHVVPVGTGQEAESTAESLLPVLASLFFDTF